MIEDRPTALLLTGEQVAAVAEVAAIAAAQAGSALSRLSSIHVRIADPEIVSKKIREIPGLFGGLDAPAMGVLVPFQGDMEGNALLLFPEKGISELEAVLLPSAEEDDLRRSAFTEVGNILTGTLLTVLSSLSEKVVVSLPPFLVQDMAGAILDSMLAEIGAFSDEVTVLVLELTGPEGGSLVRSVLIPGQAGIELLLEAAGRLRAGS
ncbi:MAG: chemotaxis protein CheC [bacterium]|nr:MAG: chemotaxis protein CheC [bacterium]